jgi:hypothetical protein
MAMDQNLKDHQSWIGYLQPEGLVVSPAALVDSQASLDLGQAAGRQIEFQQFVQWIPNPITADQEREPQVYAISSLQRLLLEFLNWPADRIQGLDPSNPIPEALKIPLRDFGETLEPTYAFLRALPGDEQTSTDETNADASKPWMLLIQELPVGTRLDVPIESKLSGWSASPSRRFERLLRETEVPIGLLTNSTHIQLIYAPRGENSGTMTFPVAAMTEISGRPILAAFHMLLSRYRLLAAPTKDRLPGLLQRSRDYQVRVSNALAKQVLEALYELLRGFQSADDMAAKKLLEEVLKENPDQIYNGLLSVLMRLVFLLYAEDQGLMPDSDVYTGHYSVHGLFQRLRSDAEQFPDTMEHRYGAWAQLLALFRLVYQGSRHKLLQMPAREGHLFDPDRYPFLEGRTSEAQYDPAKPLRLPLVPDGTVFRVLEKLLVLEGERLSYRTLDVEQIGSVYETMIGFHLRRATGVSIALKPGKSHGAPVPVNLEELLQVAGDKRKAAIKEQTDYELTTKMAAAVKSAESIDDLLVALESRIARGATPQPVSTGTMLLVPSDERRRSGSHYTPRSLTEPIVRTTLEPILKQLANPNPTRERGSIAEGASNSTPLADASGYDCPASTPQLPTPSQILDLKICDPAMGSGAFLVETCRQLAEALVDSWAAHGYKPYIPADEDELLHARRLVAQRCLYGVDKNPMAVDLAKLSLWLATLAKDHPFTFVDHTLRCGDSLVGLTRKQIVGFDLNPSAQLGFVEKEVRDRMNSVANQRKMILDAGDNMLPGMKLAKLKLADEALSLVRLAGDAVVAAFFSAEKPKDRKAIQTKHFESLEQWIQKTDLNARRELDNAITRLTAPSHHSLSGLPFHWEVEFPEVFSRENAGFDAFVGNPPFLGGARVSTTFGMSYFDFIKSQFPPAGHQCDLVGYFFRNAFNKLREKATLGFIATNTIAQGDTREGSLVPILQSNGQIYNAVKRFSWPGQAAVVASHLHVGKSMPRIQAVLNGKNVTRISSYLLVGEVDGSPHQLKSSPYYSKGSQVYGQGFLFDDSDPKATPLSRMHELAQEERYSQRIVPYIGGEEVNSMPVAIPYRYAIYLSDLETEEDLHLVPALAQIVREKVKPERDKLGSNPNNIPLKKRWWAYQAHRPELYRRLRNRERVIVHGQVGPHMEFSFLPSNWIYSQQLILFDLETNGAFATLQSRVHEVWVRLLASSMKDDLRYTPSDCFATFPLPESFEDNPRLNEVGERYLEYRTRLCKETDEGLTKLYNRLHDPNESNREIIKLREMHQDIDIAVLSAYGWLDLATRARCDFLLDYEEFDSDIDESAGLRRKRPWRFRWADDFRDEVLAKLLELNEHRASEERRSGAAAEKTPTKKGSSRKPSKKKAAPKSTPLLDKDFD